MFLVACCFCCFVLQAGRRRREAESTAAFLSSLHLQAIRECTVRGEVCLRRSCSSRGGVRLEGGGLGSRQEEEDGGRPITG